MLDLAHDMKNLTMLGLRQQRQLALAQIGERRVQLRAEQERHRVTLFTDLACSSCRTTTAELPVLQARGVSVQLLPVLGTFAELAEAQARWCDPRQFGALDLSDRLPETGCNEILAHHIGLSQWLGIKALPSWVLPNGDWYAVIRALNNCSRYWITSMPLLIRRRPRVDDSHLPATLHPLLRQIFASRGVEDPALLERSASQLLPPQRLFGMAQAVPLLAEALTAQKRILIVGDFDCDGATSSALCVLALRAMGCRHIDFLVPNRFEFGYGLTPEIVELAVARGAEFLITVDNGISSIAGVAAAKAAGMQVLVTDHHLPGQSCLTPTR